MAAELGQRPPQHAEDWVLGVCEEIVDLDEDSVVGLERVEQYEVERGYEEQAEHHGYVEGAPRVLDFAADDAEAVDPSEGEHRNQHYADRVGNPVQGPVKSVEPPVVLKSQPEEVSVGAEEVLTPAEDVVPSPEHVHRRVGEEDP